MNLSKELKQALILRLTALADDELILAHRNSEWIGHAPLLEEDIALANLSQDELGHAQCFYQLRQQLDGTAPDELVYFRGPEAFLNVQMLEYPKGDWAFTMLRQYLFDAYESLLYAELSKSQYQPLADLAQKIGKEEQFHLWHSQLWLERLGLATEESHLRMQNALDILWPLSRQLFVPLEQESILQESNIFPSHLALQEGYYDLVLPSLEAVNLKSTQTTLILASRMVHSVHLEELLIDLQEVASLDPGVEW